MNPVLPDRRRSNRVRVGDDAFVCLTMPQRKPWHILDVSRGGLSFRYVAGMETTKEASELEIVTRDTGFSMEKVPFESISDREMAGPSGSLPLRRRGVQFGDLTDLQTARLDQFITHYSVGPA